MLKRRILLPAGAALLLNACSGISNEEMLNIGLQVAQTVLENQYPAAEKKPSENNRQELPPSFNIVSGKNPKKSHESAWFPGVPQDMVFVETWVKVNEVPDKGLNFFALQVNFNNGTWAHGGIQYNYGRDWVANWGGLVNRGGGSKDYRETDPLADLEKIQNPSGKDNTGPYAWQRGKVYSIAIQRGDRVVLPPGQYSLGKPVNIPHSRTMWEWHLTIEPLDGKGPTRHSILYNSADSFKSFYVWNECGYGSCGLTQNATWYAPQYARKGTPDQAEQSLKWNFF